MTNQQIFDKVAVHLLTQNLKSRETPWGGDCLYRDDRGHKCAVGVLIPNDVYTKDMEGMPVDQIAVRYQLGFDSTNIALLGDLQFMHDDKEPHEWKAEMKIIAEENGVDGSILDRFPYF